MNVIDSRLELKRHSWYGFCSGNGIKDSYLGGGRYRMTTTTSNTVEANVGSEAAARDDYALRQVPPTWRYSRSALILALSGGSTAAFFLAFPAQLATGFGVQNVLVGMVYALVLQTALNYVFIRTASRTGLNSDLMSRGLALGFDGSAWTTLIYWVTWVIFFGIEGQILAGALAEQVGIPSWLSYLIVGGPSYR
jgi:cytosine permease